MTDTNSDERITKARENISEAVEKLRTAQTLLDDFDQEVLRDPPFGTVHDMMQSNILGRVIRLMLAAPESLKFLEREV